MAASHPSTAGQSCPRVKLGSTLAKGGECRPFRACTRLDRNLRVVVIVCAWEEDVLDRRARLPTADADLRAGCVELGSAEFTTG
jgi:hypothetical protein